MKPIRWPLLLATLLWTGCYVGPAPRYRVGEGTSSGRPPLTMEEVLRMAKGGISDAIIIESMNARGIAARPSSEELASLRKEGLSESVLAAMVTARVPAPEESMTERVYEDPDYTYYYGPWWYGPYWYAWPYWGWRYHYYPHPWYRYHYGPPPAIRRYRP